MTDSALRMTSAPRMLHAALGVPLLEEDRDGRIRRWGVEAVRCLVDRL